MRYSRALCFLLSMLVFTAPCPAGTHPSGHGVQGSYEASSVTPASVLNPLIVLDAGHGGTDVGAKVNTFMEKKLSLTTTLLTKKHLEKLGYRVSLTRNRDIFLSLQRRAAIANKMKGSLFVSIHFNAAQSSSAQGIEVFYCNSKEMWRARASKRLAGCVLRYMIDQTDATSRGVKQGNLLVLRETEMPAVLVEGGFMTNSEERGKLRDKEYLECLAVGIAQGIDRYMRM